jgi:tRNA threonylcarbamoyladenosine biosynthesis protein TsaE
MKEHAVITEKDLETIAQKVLSSLTSYSHRRASVVLLEGDLGSGKTTFTQALARELGITDYVHSPTFILKKAYSSPHVTYKKLVHVDAYRFNDPKEAKALRLEDDMSDPHTIMLVEWPSKMDEIASDVTLVFDVIDDDTRDVTIHYEKNI